MADPGGSRISVDSLGVLRAMGAGLTRTINMLASKEFLHDYRPDGVMAVVFGLGSVFHTASYLGGRLELADRTAGRAGRRPGAEDF